MHFTVKSLLHIAYNVGPGDVYIHRQYELAIFIWHDLVYAATICTAHTTSTNTLATDETVRNVARDGALGGTLCTDRHWWMRRQCAVLALT